MADKALRRLSRRELLQTLIMQCEEAERLQKEASQAQTRLNALEESYERLKEKLNIKDERLDQKDAQIAGLKRALAERDGQELRRPGTITIVPLDRKIGKRAAHCNVEQNPEAGAQRRLLHG